MPGPIVCQTKDSATTRSSFAAAAIGAIALFAVACSPASGEAPQRIPAPAQDIQEAGPNAVAQFAGGCFWCIETVFNQIQGVVEAESGYCNGQHPKPTYDDVCSGRTGHADHG